ncbi:NAD(P)-binding protein [Zopfia rhizophila CBS 207.26]|uniref:NAD(P)-binding protein n=1 Tax=Zopfia rhizophila CBS 207.26 TaxID=1314779 RepID=A0A6A6EEX2_9PEZI|nr:NAD(P)-binding protein [Zopfia rhizophila CBS 207.26]
MSFRYAEAHNTKGPGDARPTALQIVNDNDLEGKLEGKVAFVIGTSSGIGIETVRALKATGMRVFAAAQISRKQKQPSLIHLDLNSLACVRKCAKEFLEKSDKLNILVNNAAIMVCPKGRTTDGFELQFGTNHLAHFLLFNLLKEILLKSATAQFASCVVNVSSTEHRVSQIHFENMNLKGIYIPFMGYRQSKLANIYMANEIERRYGSKNLHSFSLHLSDIWTGLQKYVSDEQMNQCKENPMVVSHMTEQGAATQVWAALDKEFKGKGDLEGYTILSPGHEKYAYDEEAEKKLWKVSLELVGLKDDQLGGFGAIRPDID